jgi:archaetidylinositol phosphate synthase
MEHVREHLSILAGAEKRLLVAIARRLPDWISSDHLTALALVSMLAAGPAFAAIPLTPWAAALFVVLLVINWFGDSLDGTLARVRDRQRPRYGYYVDHVIDLAGCSALLVGMGASGLMTPAVALAVLAGYFLMAAESYLATHSRGTFKLSFAGVGPTELRIVLAIGAVKVAAAPTVILAGRELLLLDVGGAVATAGFVVAFVVSSIRNGRALFALERLPRHVTRATGAGRIEKLVPRV